MHTFPKLYSRTSTNAVQEWQIFVDKNSFFTVSGQQNGQIVQTKPTVCSGKNIGRGNETSPEDQAMKEAQARYDKQLKSGGYFENIADIDNVQFVQPMLAKKYLERLAKVVYPVGVQLKFNGGRCVATRHGLFSRKGERYISVPHIFESMKSFFALWPDAVIDGELYAPNFGQKLNEVMKLIRKTVHITQADLDKSEKLVRFYIYDGYGYDGVEKETNYRARSAAIKKNFSSNPYYCQVFTRVANTHEDVMRMFADDINAGEEGSIVRILDAPYENKRSSNLLKVKPTDDEEFKIVGVEEGIGNRAGTAGKVVCLMKDGRTFKANIKGTFEQAKDIWVHPENYVGKTATIFFYGYTGKLTETVDGIEKTFATGRPNYAQFDCNRSFGGAADKDESD